MRTGSVSERFFGSTTSTRRWSALAIVAVTVVALGWWWLPTIRGDADETDVTFIGDGFLWGAQREITQRTHEDGFSLTWAPETASWCDAPDAVRLIVGNDHPSRVVVSFSTEGTCGVAPAELRAQVAAAAGSAKLIVVTNPDAVEAVVPTPDSTVVDPAQLLGPAGTLDRGCLWWDSARCRPDGHIEVRHTDGTLSISGQTRVARLIVAALR